MSNMPALVVCTSASFPFFIQTNNQHICIYFTLETEHVLQTLDFYKKKQLPIPATLHFKQHFSEIN